MKMKAFFYTFLAVLHVQAFGMDDKKLTFGGQEIISMVYQQEKFFAYYQATLENNDLVRATFFHGGSLQGAYDCTYIKPKQRMKFGRNLPNSTFEKLAYSYKQYQDKQ